MNSRIPLLPLCAVVVSMTLVAPAFAQDEINEDALFDDTATVVESQALTESGTVKNERDEKSVSLSGNVAATAGGGLSRTWFSEQSLANSSFAGQAVAGLNGDIRLPMSVKSFVGAQILYAGSLDSTRFLLNELFLDWNFGYRVFFRAGKQVLQWGRGYFFNPVDFVNVDKKPFLDELAGRQGAYGLKVHVPFGTKVNLYSFLGMGDVRRPDSVALSVKSEFLVGGTEFAFSAWLRRHSPPVFGLDFSTGIGAFAVTGEAALYRSLDTMSLGFNGPVPELDTATLHWVPRISLGAGRAFDVGNSNGRIMVNAEGYYNHAGSGRKNLTQIQGHVDSLRSLPDDAGAGMLDMLLGLLPAPNTMSRWYGALFVSFSQFILYDMTLSANALYNFTQQCAVVQAGLSYTTIHNLSFSLLLTGFPGHDYTEYTLAGKGLNVELRSAMQF